MFAPVLLSQPAKINGDKWIDYAMEWSLVTCAMVLIYRRATVCEFHIVFQWVISFETSFFTRCGLGCYMYQIPSIVMFGFSRSLKVTNADV